MGGMMSYLFIGMLYDESCEEELLKNSKTGLQGAPNQYQLGMISGLESLLEKQISVISSYPVGAYPQSNKKLFYKDSKSSLTEYIDINYIGFFNYYIIREIIRAKKIIKLASNFIDNHNEIVVFIYGLELAFTPVVKKLKKIYGDKVRIIFIVPDLPGSYGIQRKIWTPHGVWDRLFVKEKINMTKYADGCVLLTDSMKHPLSICNKPYCVVEGFLPTCINKNEIFRKSTKRVILYTGSLNIKFGICELVDTFTQIDDSDYELWICGSGNGKKYIEEKANEDNRIVYYGYVNKEKVISLQQQATVLINPRKNEGEYTKYSFPSKTLEYLVSGRPTIMYKLDGIPDEYDSYLFYVQDNTIEALRDKIIEICSMPEEELASFGAKARKWVLSKKNNITQAEKVLKMLDCLAKDEEV